MSSMNWTENHPTHGRWTTEDEIHFLDNLGHWSAAYPQPLKVSDKLKALKDYRKAIELRENWGEMHPERVKRHIDMLIDSYSKVMSPRKDYRA